MTAQNFQVKITEDLNIMDNRLQNLEEQMKSVDKKISQVVEAILGNSLTNQGGFVKEIEEIRKDQELIRKTHRQVYISMDKRINKIEQFYQRIIWTAGIIVGAVLLLRFGLEFYEKVLTVIE